MLRRLRLKNFRKHKDREFELARVTTFYGLNNSGKSTIISAIRWVLLNKPRGDKIKGRYGKAKFVEAEIDLDKHTITRRRGKQNLYKLDGKKLKAFKFNPPRDVELLANVSDVNFQGQLDGPFWFGIRPAQVSRELNQIINLSEIDAALSAAAKEVRSRRSEVKVSKERLDKARKQVAQTSWAKHLSKKVDSLVALQVKRDVLRQRIDMLSVVIKSLVTLHEKKDRLAIVLNLARDLRANKRKQEHIAKRAKKLGALVGRISHLKQLRDELQIPSTEKLQELLTKRNKLNDRCRQLATLCLTIPQLEYEKCGIENRLKKT